MPIITLFRSILIASLVLGVLSVIAAESLSASMPIALQGYIEYKNSSMSETATILFGLFALIVLVMMVVSLVGIWKFRSWGRSLYVILTLFAMIVIPLLGPVVMNAWEALFGDMSLLLEGIVIAMMFTGPVADKFTSPVRAS